jgi:GWxTD domain-containing protein
MRIRAFITATMVLSVAAVGLAANLSKTFDEWGKGPAQHLMTKEELKQWKSLNSDSQAQAFIDLFWARRDPSPATPRNEYREQFDLIVKTADEQFKETGTRGSLTERGKLFILLGSPTNRTRRVETAASSTAPGESTSTAQAPSIVTETWTYEGARVPEFVGSPKLEVVFRDDFSPGRFRVVRSTMKVAELTEKAIEQAMTSPNLRAVPTYEAQARPAAAATRPATVVAETSVPAPSLTLPTEFKTTSLQTAVAEFKSAKTSPYKDVYVTYGEFVTPEGNYFIPVQLYLTKSPVAQADQDVTFFGVVEDEQGTIVGVFEEPVKLRASKNELFTDRSLTIPPGKYKGTFGIATAGKPLAIAQTAMELAGIDKDTSGLSRLILSNNIYPMTAAQMPTDPYAFGGIKVVPKGDQTFSRQDELWYFFELRNPGVDETGKTKIQVKVDVEAKSGQKMGAPLQETPAEPLKGVPGHFGIGSSIPLAGFSPGEYTMKIKVIDTIKKQTYNLQEKFKIVG